MNIQSIPHKAVSAIQSVEEQISFAPLKAGLLSYGAPESICGHDDRVQVTNTLAVPYQWIVRLSINFQGVQYVGSGFVVSASQAQDRLVIATSGHCVYDSNSGKFADSVTVVPQANGTLQPLGSKTVTSGNLRASAGWRSGQGQTSDYGVILVPWTGTWGVGMWVADDTNLQNRTVMNSGYPADKSPYGFNWEDTGPISTVEQNMLRYMNDTYGGESGSPVLALKQGADWGEPQNVWCVGIHGYGGCPNGAVRMTNAVFNDYLGWAKEPLV